MTFCISTADRITTVGRGEMLSSNRIVNFFLQSYERLERTLCLQSGMDISAVHISAQLPQKCIYIFIRQMCPVRDY